MAEFKRILVAIDFSDISLEALGCAVDLATRLDAEISLLHVVQAHASELPDGGLDDAEASIERALAAATAQLGELADARLKGKLAYECTVCPGQPAAEINRTCETGSADLIVIGTHGRSGLAHLIMGSVAEDVLRHAKVPVLVVRGR